MFVASARLFSVGWLRVGRVRRQVLLTLGRPVLYALLIVAVTLLASQGPAQFIYFQF